MNTHSDPHDETRLRRVARAVVLGVLVAAAALAAIHARPATSAAWHWPQEHELYRWLERDLGPYLAQTLSRHPRFAGEPVTFAAVRDEALVAAPDALTEDLIARLRAQLQKAPGVHLVWRAAEPSEAPCADTPQAAYRVTVEVRALGARHRVAVRALDVAEQRWVAGVAKEWEGTLDRVQRRALAARPAPRHDLGERAAPFEAAQADLLGERLGAALRSRVCGFVGEPLAVWVERSAQAPPAVDKALTLAARHLARASEASLVAAREDANVILSAQIVAIDPVLHQVWLTVRPVSRDPALPEFDAQAYLALHDAPRVEPERPAGPVAVAPEPLPPADGARATVAPRWATVRTLTPRDRRACATANPWRGGAAPASGMHAVDAEACYALELEVHRDAVVFLLGDEGDAGLVRLLPSYCRTYGRIHTTVRRGDTLRFPARDRGRRHALFAPAEGGYDTFYAIVVTDQRAADRIEAALAPLGDACGRRGQRATAAAQLQSLETLLDDLAGRAALQAVEVRYRPRHAQLARSE